MRVLALAALAVLGCRKPAAEAAPDTAPPALEPAPLVTVTDPFQPPTPIDLPPPGDPMAPIVETVTVDGGVAPGAAAPTDPFVAAIASVQQAAVGCFQGLPPGDYAATIEVVVTPTGTATRATVTSGPTEADVRKCLESAAQRGYPASPNGRKLSIDVRVKG